MRLSAVAASDTSSALVGSSQSRSAGGTMIARASAARWRCPPDSWAGFARATSAGQADERERFRDPFAARDPAEILVVQPLADELADRHPRGQ